MPTPFTFKDTLQGMIDAKKALDIAIVRSNKEARQDAVEAYANMRKQQEKNLRVKFDAIVHQRKVDIAHGEAISINKRKNFKRDIKFFTQKFTKPIKKALGGIAKAGLNMATGFLPFLDAIGVFEPILTVVADLIDLFAGRLIEKLMPAFMSIIDILLSDSVMSLIDNLALLFAAFLVPLISLIETILPPIITLIDKLVVAFTPLIEDVMEALTPIIEDLFDAFMPLIDSFIDDLLPILGPLLKAIIPIIDIGLTPLKLILQILSPILEALSPLFKLVEDALIAVEEPLLILAHILEVDLYEAVKVGAYAVAIFLDIITLGFARAVTSTTQLFATIDAANVAADEAAAERLKTIPPKPIIQPHNKPLGILQEGTPYVPQSGLYHLTKGERVITAQENIGGGDIHIVVEGNLVGQNAMRELTEEIEYKRAIGRL